MRCYVKLEYLVNQIHTLCYDKNAQKYVHNVLKYIMYIIYIMYIKKII